MEILTRIEQRLALPGDSETLRSQKVLSVGLMIGGSLFTVTNYFIYLRVGMAWPGVLYALWAVTILLAGGLILAIPRLWRPVALLIILLTVVVTMATSVLSGGFQSGLEAAIWMLLGPILAALFFGFRFTVFTLLVYISGVLTAVYLESYALSVAPELTFDKRMMITTGNMVMIGILVTAAILYLLRQVDFFRRRANELLLNMLPPPIAARLKERKETIADSYSAVTVLFADMVGSTPLFANLEPAEAVDWLNEVFSCFDRLVERHGLEKIRTIGDNYMVGSGVPTPRADHAQAMARFALEMVSELEQIPARKGQRMQFRIGMHSGPLVAGVIGTKKYQYDLWGDTVNIASRMESQGEAGMVQISKATYDLIKDDFRCFGRGIMSVKGRGQMETWFLLGEFD